MNGNGHGPKSGVYRLGLTHKQKRKGKYKKPRRSMRRALTGY